MNFEDLVKVNATIKTTDIKGKNYAEVNQRIKAFRMLYPEGSITTELLSNDGDTCVFKATIINDSGIVLGTGTAFENKGSSFINKTSYIENCETSAVGRALAMCGIGIDVSVASYEEVANAIENQNESAGGDKKSSHTNKKEGCTNLDNQKQETSPAFPDKDKLLEFAKSKYPEGSKPLEALLDLWKVSSIDEANENQLRAIWSKYNQ